MNKNQIEDLIKEIVGAEKQRNRSGSVLDADYVLDLLQVKLTEYGIIDFYEPYTTKFEWIESEGGEVQLLSHFHAHRLQAQELGKVI